MGCSQSTVAVNPDRASVCPPGDSRCVSKGSQNPPLIVFDSLRPNKKPEGTIRPMLPITSEAKIDLKEVTEIVCSRLVRTPIHFLNSGESQSDSDEHGKSKISRSTVPFNHHVPTTFQNKVDPSLDSYSHSNQKETHEAVTLQKELAKAQIFSNKTVHKRGHLNMAEYCQKVSKVKAFSIRTRKNAIDIIADVKQRLPSLVRKDSDSTTPHLYPEQPTKKVLHKPNNTSNMPTSANYNNNILIRRLMRQNTIRESHMSKLSPRKLWATRSNLAHCPDSRTKSGDVKKLSRFASIKVEATRPSIKASKLFVFEHTISEKPAPATNLNDIRKHDELRTAGRANSNLPNDITFALSFESDSSSASSMIEVELSGPN